MNRFRPSVLALAGELFVGVNAMLGQTATFQTRFVTANGVKLNYLDWGGKGESLVYLTELGGIADDFDPIAKRVTGHFHVIGLTRRGQGESEKPSSGYDVDTLAQDIRAFLDVLNSKRAILVGYSVAGNGETRFAGLYPKRVAKLVYLDAAFDHASDRELFDRVRLQFSLSQIKLDDPYGSALFAGSNRFHPDSAKVMAPRSAFM